MRRRVKSKGQRRKLWAPHKAEHCDREQRHAFQTVTKLLFGPCNGFHSANISLHPYLDYLNDVFVVNFIQNNNLLIDGHPVSSADDHAALNIIQHLVPVLSNADFFTASLDNLTEAIGQKIAFQTDPASASTQYNTTKSAAELLFTALGLFSALYTPDQFDMRLCQVSSRGTGDRFHQGSPFPASGNARRPIHILLRGIDIWPGSIPRRGSAALKEQLETPKSMTIVSRTLTYYHLYTIGAISIRWCSQLPQHLAFDPNSKELSLFRFPSYCIYAQSEHALIHKALHALMQARDGLPKPFDSSAYLKEVLLTYRVFFGHDKKSRRLFTQREKPKLGAFGELDPLLVYLCSTRSLKDDEVNIGVFDNEIYSTLGDFPVVGDRLVALQEYMGKFDPGGLRKLWQDRRNPFQWFTFWAVIWIGGISVLLAIIQTLAQIVQIIITLR